MIVEEKQNPLGIEKIGELFLERWRFLLLSLMW